MSGSNLPIYDAKECLLFALGRNAIYAACKILRLVPEDEVLTPAFDCDSALTPFRVIGLKLNFFRSHPYSFSADINDIKKKITSKTKLIHIINHFGMPQPWDELLALKEETGIPILEDNAYSLFSKLNDRLFGTFGDISIFSLRKNLPLIDGGLLYLNNRKYEFNFIDEETEYFRPSQYFELLRLAARNTKLYAFMRYGLKRLFPMSEAPPPLYSEDQGVYPACSVRDVIGKEFSCDYLRPMSGLAKKQLDRFTPKDFVEIGEKKRYYYKWLSMKLKDIEGIEVLWPELPDGVVPFCVSCLFNSKRDIFLKILRRKYEVMAWPTLSKMVLDRLDDFPEVKLLGKKLLQINLPADKVRLPYFAKKMEILVKDITELSKWNTVG